MPSENRQTEKKVISDTGLCCYPIICHEKCQIVLFSLLNGQKLCMLYYIDTTIAEAKKRGAICGYQTEVKYSGYTGGSSYV